MKITWDSLADVLYISHPEPLPALTRPGPAGLIYRYTDGTPTGVTVLDAVEDWSARWGALAYHVAGFLPVYQSDVLDAIGDAIAPAKPS